MRHTLARSLIRLTGTFARRMLIGPGPTATGVTVGVVDDPVHPVRLVRAAGVLDPVTIERVVSAWEHVTAPYLVHLDVQDARIVDATTMSRLERAVDHLERRRIDVRIVGIDPDHPALVSRQTI